MGRFHRHDDTVHTHEHDHVRHEHDHGDHRHYETGKQRIDVLEAIFAENDVRAEANRAAFESNRGFGGECHLFARSMRPRRFCRSAPAPAPVWAPGSAG